MEDKINEIARAFISSCAIKLDKEILGTSFENDKKANIEYWDSLNKIEPLELIDNTDDL